MSVWNSWRGELLKARADGVAAVSDC